MNQIKISVAPDHNGFVAPNTVRIFAYDPKRRVEVELQTVTGLRFESSFENGRLRFRAQLDVIDPAIDLNVPVEQIDVVGDRNYTLKQDGDDELVLDLRVTNQRLRGDIDAMEREMEARLEKAEKLAARVAELEEKDKVQTERIAHLEKLASSKPDDTQVFTPSVSTTTTGAGKPAKK